MYVDAKIRTLMDPSDERAAHICTHAHAHKHARAPTHTRISICSCADVCSQMY